jgi:hypothetical protein
VLLGYGFCIENNPCDFYLFKLISPPPEIHQKFKNKIPEHFKSEQCTVEELRFFLIGSNHYTKSYGTPLGLSCLRGIPEALVLATQVLIVHTMGFQELEEDGSPNLDVWYATLDTLFHKVEVNRDAIQQFGSELPSKPRNQREQSAKLYRDGQLRILNEIHGELEAFLEPLEVGQTTLKDAFANLKLPV